MTIDNLGTVYSFFNQYVYQEAKNSISDLKKFYSTNPNTRDNTLIFNLLDAIDTYEFGNVDVPLFQSVIAKSGKNQVEGDEILREILKWKNFTKDQIKPSIEQLHNIIAMTFLDKAMNLYRGNPIEYIKYVKNGELKLSDTRVFTSIPFNSIDINSIIAENNNSYIKSHYEWINKVFGAVPGYPRGQMVIVCAASGVGKSLFSMTEALSMASRGHKVLYVGLGDNNMKDFLVRMGAIYTGASFEETYYNLNNVYNALSQTVGDNLEITINPANSVSAEDIVEYAKTRDYEVVFVDYDGNLAGVADGESMYNTYGSVYTKFNELVLMGKSLFICSQIKISAFGNSVIEMQDVGESSRKQHTADMIIGIGREVDSPNNLHIINVSKNRRGRMYKAYTIRLNNGRFIEVPREIYRQLKEDPTERDWTETEIGLLVNKYNQNFSQVQSSIASAEQNMLSTSSPVAAAGSTFSPAIPKAKSNNNKNMPFS